MLPIKWFLLVFHVKGFANKIIVPDIQAIIRHILWNKYAKQYATITKHGFSTSSNSEWLLSTGKTMPNNTTRTTTTFKPVSLLSISQENGR